MAEKLKMKNDIVFKAFFSRNERYLKYFLSAILGEDIEIKKVMHDVRLEQLAKEMKYGILDLEVELTSGEVVNIEMQLKDNKNIEKRTTFYASKKIVEQIEPRQDYENLKRVIVIAILDYTLTKLPDYVTETVRVAKNDKEYELNNEVKYYYIELGKFRKNPHMDKRVDQWLAFLDMERGDLLEMAKKNNKEVKEAVKDYEVLVGDEEIKRLAEIRLMSELEEKSALATARAKGTEAGLKEGIQKGLEKGVKQGLQEGHKQGLQEGHKKGLQEGHKKGLQEGHEKGMKEGREKGLQEGKKVGSKETKIEIAKTMIKMGLTKEQISKATDLTMEEIENLKER